MRKRWILLLLAGWAAASCIYPYEAELQSPDHSILVVEGSIALGGEASLSVLTMKSLRDSPGGAFSRANVQRWWVEDDAGTQYRNSSTGGKISLKSAPAGRSYKMVMQIDGKTYSTPFQHPLPPPEIKNISFWADNEWVYAGISLESGAESSGYAAISIEEIWKFHTIFQAEFDFDPKKGVYVPMEADSPNYHYWCWRHLTGTTEQVLDYAYNDGKVDDYIFHSFARNDERNHGDYSVKVRVRTLTRDESVYLKNLQKKKGESSNLFSPNPGEVPGNIVCEDNPSEQVLGYVSVMDYSTSTAQLDDRFLLKDEYDDSWFQWIPYGMESYYYDNLQWRPVRYYFPDDIEHKMMGWVERRCVDCTYTGGSTEQPLFND